MNENKYTIEYKWENGSSSLAGTSFSPAAAEVDAIYLLSAIFGFGKFEIVSVITEETKPIDNSWWELLPLT